MELRKRRPTARFGDSVTLDIVLNIAERCRRIVLFTGSGISAASGMSMFSTRNGLYERARKKFKVQDGIKLFTYSFYRQRRAEVQAFFAQIYSEAQASRAATGHYAMAQLRQLGALQRHYTLNIDGLSEVVGMDTWHHERNPRGSTVEMHGNIRQLVCPTCHAVEPLSRHNINLMRAQQPVPCSSCGQDQLRFKVMLYDDGEGDCITPEHVFDVLEDDLKVCDMVVWAGISFQQSASVEYFRRVRHMLGTLGRLNSVPQVLVNPSEEPYFNLLSAMSNPNELQLLDLRETSDAAFPAMVQRIREAIMHEAAENSFAGSVAVNYGVGIGAQAGAVPGTAAAAAALPMAEPTPGAMGSAGIEIVGAGGPECVVNASILGADFRTKAETLGLSSIKMEAVATPNIVIDINTHEGSCRVSSGGAPVETAATGSSPEPEPKSAHCGLATRSVKSSREPDEGEGAGPLFVDDADDEDYVEGKDEEEGRCRRNGRGRLRARGSANRVKGRGRGRGKAGGSCSRGVSQACAASSHPGQETFPQMQSPSALLLSLAPGAGLLLAGSPERSLLPLPQPCLRPALNGLGQSPPPLPPQQLMHVGPQPQLLLFQQLQLPQQPQQAAQQLQQLQQSLQLRQLREQHQQASSLELLQRLHALQQLQFMQQLPTLSLQLPQLPQLQLQQAEATPPPQLAPVQLVSSVSTLQQPSAAPASLDRLQQQSLGLDLLAPPLLLQQDLQQRASERRPVQDLQGQVLRLVELQRSLLQTDTPVGCWGATGEPRPPEPCLAHSGNAQPADAGTAA